MGGYRPLSICRTRFIDVGSWKWHLIVGLYFFNEPKFFGFIVVNCYNIRGAYRIVDCKLFVVPDNSRLSVPSAAVDRINVFTEHTGIQAVSVLLTRTMIGCPITARSIDTSMWWRRQTYRMAETFRWVNMLYFDLFTNLKSSGFRCCTVSQNSNPKNYIVI